MDKDLIINSSPTGIEIALLEDKRLVEIHKEKTNKIFSVGDIFLGSVKKLRPGLNAAFVDIGHKKEAFLHYTDLGPPLRGLLKYTNGAIEGKLNTQFLEHFPKEKPILKSGKIDEVLKKGDLMMVQILKEPISTKGPRLSCEVTIAGRYLVLCPFGEGISISKKISNKDERKRLQVLIESIKPKGFGIIVRTVAEGKGVADLYESMEVLMAKWKTVFEELKDAKGPKKLLSEIDKTSSILREILDDSFNKIVVNDGEMFQSIKDYLFEIAPDKTKLVSHYTQNFPIFEKLNVSRQIKSSFGKTYTMSSGAYLVMEQTEAMHVIDVNSGPKFSKVNQEESAKMVNIESAKEIARQLRLRDIGGLIIIDFIDMRSADARNYLLKSMKDYMSGDRARHTVLPLSKFGLMQITRERVRPAVTINTAEICSVCNGTGKTTPTLLVTDNILRDFKHIIKNRPKAKITLSVHPFIEAYLTKNLYSIKYQWYWKYGKLLNIQENSDLGLLDYRFYDSYGEEIKLD